jgi:hypothetical protein
VKLYRPDRFKQESKTEEGISDNSTKTVKLDEESNFKSERVNSNSLQLKAAPIPTRINVATDRLRCFYYTTLPGICNIRLVLCMMCLIGHDSGVLAM